MKKLLIIKILFPSLLITLFFAAQVSTTIDNFFLPGSQPSVRTFEAPSKCDNCHSNIKENSDIAFEPVFGWKGSMMSQAMRDPLYLAALTIANQDAAFAGDLCIRCHAPAGWLSGRSTNPIDGNTSGDSLNNDDKEGVDCNFCHELINPNSNNPEDLAVINALDINKPPFVDGKYQSGNGVFIIDDNLSRRHGPFDAAPASHTAYKDAYYQESAYCATCHDVSNPVFILNEATGNYDLNTTPNQSPSFNTYKMFPSERTYSEWTQSQYANGGVTNTVFGDVSSCQDCHMKNVTGYGANKKSPERTDLPMHDMTGGNTFVPLLIKQLYSSNASVNTDALDAGILRAKGMLQNAASLDVGATLEANGYNLKVTVSNETGHKLPSGYPEGRRMWINVIAKNGNDIVYESGAYDETTAVLEKYDTNGNESKIYEAKLGMSSNPGVESFHFALNNVILKDNRIPPRGFTNANYEKIQAAPIGYSYEDGQFSDITEYNLPLETTHVEVKLKYQTTSKEYIEFLRDENQTNSAGQDLYNLWATNGKSTPEIMNEFSNEISNIALAIENIDYLFIKPLLVYPNPASEELNITFKLINSEILVIDVFDMTGRKIKNIFKGFQPNIEKTIKWNTSNISSGIYIVKFKLGNKLTTKRVQIK